MKLFENRFLNRVLHKTLWAVLLPLCVLWGSVQAIDTPENGSDQARSNRPQTPTELPSQWQGSPLRPLALSEVETRFARHFPGSIARLTDGETVLVLRTVRQPTRMLHPATDCYKGLGYHIRDEQLEAVAGHARKRCFIAERGGQRIRVCEYIEDARGQTFTDASAWYWAAIAGQSAGPWQAFTEARPL